MKMIQKWGRPTDFNAKKLKSVFELFQSSNSNCAAGCKHAVWTGQPGSAVGVFRLKLYFLPHQTLPHRELCA